MFIEKFGDFVMDGDTIKCVVDGFECVATLHRDDDAGDPSERDEGFFPEIEDYEDSAEFHAEYERMTEIYLAWERDEWHFYGVAVTVYKAGILLTHKYHHAIWGIEGNYPGSDNGYLSDVINEHGLLDDALDAARAKIKELGA